MKTQLKKNASKLVLVSLIAAGMLPLGAHAHRTWLLPSSTQVEGKEPWVTIDAAVSENLFEFETNALKLEGLSIIGPDGAAITPENPFSGRLRSSFDLKLSMPGTYRIGMVNETVMASYKLNGENKRWRGSEEMLAKEVPANAEDLRVTRMHSRRETFVTSGKPNNGAFKISGSGLELAPITHPNELTAGEQSRFRLLLDGKPAANLGVSVVPGGVRYRGVLNEIRLATDAKGEFSVAWPGPGMYQVNAAWPPAPAAGSGQTMPPRRLSYGGTLEVLPQ
jgi:uncharacterized GH25 family protein